MALLNPVRVDGKRFSWEGSKGVAEISDLDINGFERVWDDAVDVGITLVGKVEEVVFVLNSTDRHDGEIAGWNLVSVNRAGRTDGRFNILIIND